MRRKQTAGRVAAILVLATGVLGIASGQPPAPPRETTYSPPSLGATSPANQLYSPLVVTPPPPPASETSYNAPPPKPRTFTLGILTTRPGSFAWDGLRYQLQSAAPQAYGTPLLEASKGGANIDEQFQQASKAGRADLWLVDSPDPRVATPWLVRADLLGLKTLLLTEEFVKQGRLGRALVLAPNLVGAEAGRAAIDAAKDAGVVLLLSTTAATESDRLRLDAFRTSFRSGSKAQLAEATLPVEGPDGAVAAALKANPGATVVAMLDESASRAGITALRAAGSKLPAIAVGNSAFLREAFGKRDIVVLLRTDHAKILELAKEKAAKMEDLPVAIGPKVDKR